VATRRINVVDPNNGGGSGGGGGTCYDRVRASGPETYSAGDRGPSTITTSAPTTAVALLHLGAPGRGPLLGSRPFATGHVRQTAIATSRTAAVDEYLLPLPYEYLGYDTAANPDLRRLLRGGRNTQAEPRRVYRMAVAAAVAAPASRRRALRTGQTCGTLDDGLRFTC